MDASEREELLTILRSLAAWVQLNSMRIAAMEQFLKQKHGISEEEWERNLAESHLDWSSDPILREFLRDAPKL